MKEYIFIHGKNASLSQYELHRVYGNEIVFQSQAFSVLRTSRTMERKDMNRLGGTIKICEVFTEAPPDRIEKFAQTDKILFAVSQYGVQGQLSKPLMDLKKELRSRGRNARFLNKDFTNVSSGQLNQSNILEKGIDLVKCYYKLPAELQGREVWAQTVFFQDIDSYSLRDYEKPKRDMKIGMLPPKLAQMMINFAQPESSSTVYDPFCGLGTIPMEAALMGLQTMASDINGRMVEAAATNLKWLSEKFGSAAAKPEQVFLHDATKPFPKERVPSDMTIVTEGYLGPLLLRFPSPQEQKQIFDLLHEINRKFFSEISKLMKPGNRVVFCFPFFRVRQEKVFYPDTLIKEYLKNGFELQQELRSLLYERETQVVGREVVVMRK